MKALRHLRRLALVAAALCAGAATVSAQNTTSNISATKHNLSATSGNAVRAQAPGSGGTDQICVFCHTPHGANTTAPAPLWNRSLSTATYTPYTSSSLDAATILGGQLGQPGGSSKLCLSCHDGTLALGTVANAPGSGTGGSIAMTGAGAGGTMPAGSGVTTGATRNLGTDLRNDHPISFTFDSTLATRDGELRTPPYSVGGAVVVGPRSGGNRPLLPLDHQNYVQCTTCHDPHLAGDSIKFLRLNRFQQTAAPGAAFNSANDQICLGCHDRLGTVWGQSAHADPSVASYPYKAAAAAQREFPATTQVWQAACLNCHDTHAVQGTRRLLREGTDGAGSPKAGGNPAQEQTCYQCHTTSANSIITVPTMTATTGVPDIQTEFGRAIRMPITTASQPASSEVHDIGGNFNDAGFIDCTTPNNRCGADFIESRARLGAGNHVNRHVECTDCHNPHRVLKNALFNNQGSNTRRTHVVGGASGNIASGALRGTWGVEPIYANVNADWPVVPTSYAMKRGDPGANTSTARVEPYLTREYQLCFKCHSDYGAGSQMPLLTNTASGGTPSGTNSMTRFTNIAAEFAVNANETLTGTDQGELGQCSGGCPTNYTNIEPSQVNHRSWHPVTFPTGRSHAERRIGNTAGSNFRTPFNGTTSPDGVGLQTMHCSDCHGHDGTWTQGSGPNLNTVQGPHGSSQNFLLKGTWTTATSIGSAGFCGNCHNPTAGTDGLSDSGTGRTSGFNSHNSSSKGGHGNAHNAKSCMRCHVAVPHGWRNKALLVNLNCVGQEGGQSGSCVSVSGAGVSNTNRVTLSPYYVESYLRVVTWRASGNWSETSCGAGARGGNILKDAGKDWMTDGNQC